MPLTRRVLPGATTWAPAGPKPKALRRATVSAAADLIILGPRRLVVGQDRKKRNPGPNFLTVLLRHHPRDLGNVTEVVHHPGGQQLTQRHRPQHGVLARQDQLRRGELPRLKQRQIGTSEPGKLAQQRIQGAVGVAGQVPEAVVGLEQRGAAGQDQSGPRDPVGLLPIDEVTDVVEGAEGVGTLPAPDPGLGSALQQHLQGRRGTAEYINRLLEIEIHRVQDPFERRNLPNCRCVFRRRALWFDPNLPYPLMYGQGKRSYTCSAFPMRSPGKYARPA